MDIFKNYVDFMFKNLPQEERVNQAKNELLTRMDNRFNELVRSGKSENESVSVVISEFNDLQKIAVEFGIVDLLSSNRDTENTKSENAFNFASQNEPLKQSKPVEKRKITTDIVESFFQARKKVGIMLASGVALFIMCVCGPILTDAFGISEVTGVFCMFLFIAAGVLLCIFSSFQMEDLSFLKNEPCSLENEAKEFIKQKKRENLKVFQIMISIGVLLCTLSIFPPMFLKYNSDFGAALLFVFVAAGVFLIIYANVIKNSYTKLLALEENYIPQMTEHKNKKFQKINGVYWQSVTCIYLVVSFVTHRWDISWLLWPVAAVAFTLLKVIFSDEE